METVLEVFDTEAEAIAFTEGLEYAESVEFESPYEQGGKFVVEVRTFS